MPDDSGETDPEATIVQREVETTEDRANYHVLETIAAIEEVDVTDLPPMFDRVDHILANLFSEPPAPEAQVEITFSFHGYRVTVGQDGTVILRKLDADVDETE